MKELHPLINPKSSHYDNSEKTTIEKIEDVLTVEQMIGASFFNVMKYTDRLHHKGQKESDLEKIVTYQRYYDFLINIDVRLLHLKVSDAYKRLGIEWRYR